MPDPRTATQPAAPLADTGVVALMSEFGEYLRQRRAELQPVDVGLPTTPFRRVQGLRREEVAQLAGVSTDYYTRLEQGRDLSPSAAVLDALARALELDPAGRAHLQHLAHPIRPARRRPTGIQRARPAVRSMLDSWADQPAFVLGRRGDVLATNALARALLADFDAMPYADRNLTKWILLDPAARELYVDWAQIASEMVAILRLDAGAHPDDRRTTELVGELILNSPEFPRWWAEHKVLDRTWGHKRFRHPVVGPLEIDYEALQLPGDPDQTLFVYRAPDGDTRSAEALKLLASWNAQTTPGRTSTSRQLDPETG
jgi:transcriptional regulator with XRE-family HTH domain